jgi:hypothetical protein
MPKTTPRPKPFGDGEEEVEKRQNNGYVKPTFVRCDLTADQKLEMANWANACNADDLLDRIVVSTSEGYILSLKPSEEGYQASLTQSRKPSIGVPNTGMSLVTRASTPERALWSLYYKHTQVLGKDWSQAKSTDLDW